MKEKMDKDNRLLPWVEVSEDVFYKHIKNFQKPLEKDITHICEPPMVTYNDFSEGKMWPDSVVAKIKLFDYNEKKYFYLLSSDFSNFDN